MFYNFSFLAKPSMNFIQLWRDDRALSKILCSIIPIPVHDQGHRLWILCVKSLQCQLLQSLWLIWIMFGMNGYKILKCFRKEKRISGELPCLATGLIGFVMRRPNMFFVWLQWSTLRLTDVWGFMANLRTHGFWTLPCSKVLARNPRPHQT